MSPEPGQGSKVSSNDHNTQYLHLFHLLKLLEGVHFNDVVIQVIDIELGGQPDLVAGVIPDINTLVISHTCHLSPVSLPGPLPQGHLLVSQETRVQDPLHHPVPQILANEDELLASVTIGIILKTNYVDIDKIG